MVRAGVRAGPPDKPGHPSAGPASHGWGGRGTPPEGRTVEWGQGCWPGPGGQGEPPARPAGGTRRSGRAGQARRPLWAGELLSPGCSAPAGVPRAPQDRTERRSEVGPSFRKPSGPAPSSGSAQHPCIPARGALSGPVGPGLPQAWPSDASPKPVSSGWAPSSSEAWSALPGGHTGVRPAAPPWRCCSSVATSRCPAASACGGRGREAGAALTTRAGPTSPSRLLLPRHPGPPGSGWDSEGDSPLGS